MTLRERVGGYLRPSVLPLAQHCTLAPVLSFENQNEPRSPEADRGTRLHKEIEQVIRGQAQAKSPVVKSLFRVWRPVEGGACEQELELRDPDTGELLTKGTTDYAYPILATSYVIDWKSGKEEYVDPPDFNLQLKIYGLMAALKHGSQSFAVGLCFLRRDAPEWRWSRLFVDDEWQRIADTVSAIYARPVEPTPGEHCSKCFQRKRCPVNGGER